MRADPAQFLPLGYKFRLAELAKKGRSVGFDL